MLFQQQATAIQQNCGVHGGLAAFPRSRQSHPCQHSGGQLAGCRCQFIDRSSAARQKARLFKKVGRGIAAYAEFREYRQPSAQLDSPPARGNDAFKVTAEIPDSGIDLGQCNLHLLSLIPKDERAASLKDGPCSRGSRKLI